MTESEEEDVSRKAAKTQRKQGGVFRSLPLLRNSDDFATTFQRWHSFLRKIIAATRGKNDGATRQGSGSFTALSAGGGIRPGRLRRVTLATRRFAPAPPAAGGGGRGGARGMGWRATVEPVLKHGPNTGYAGKGHEWP